MLSDEEIVGYYDRYSNAVLWPFLHALPAWSSDNDWETYQRVNERFADVVAREWRPGDQIWVHDFHLMLLPALLRARCPQARILFFLHTPFPSAERFAAHDHGAALIDGLLGADVVGFHTREYAGNFVAAVARQRGLRSNPHEVVVGDRRVAVLARGMGIDVSAFASCAAQPEVIARASAIRGAGPLFISVDRLDYTKGIPQRLAAFERLLEDEPRLQGHARLLQLAIPSRESVAGYAEIRRTVEGDVRRINQRFGTATWTPVCHHFYSVEMSTLVALYRAADVMLVTPLRDGMNLVAKEFVASRIDGDGVLILSEQAGAATELRAALRVDPHDVGRLARTMASALQMLPAERQARMRRMQLAVASNDIHQWARYLLDAAREPGLRRGA